MDIVSSTIEDFPIIAEIHNRANCIYYSIYSTTELKNLHDLIETTESIAETAKSKFILCAKGIDNVTTGYIIFRIKNKSVIWISSLFVDPIDQKKGVGSLLLKAVEDFAKKSHINVVALETHKGAFWAVNFYKKNDYKLINDKLSTFPFDSVLDKPPVKNRPLFGKIIS